MENDKNTYSRMTSEEWHMATGEYVKPNTTIVYDNEYGGELIIEILE